MTAKTKKTISKKENPTDALGSLLANTYTLVLKTHNYHWNVTGPYFSSLHTLFENQYTELFAAADSIAERIRALGSKAPGSFSEFSAISSITEAKTGISAKKMTEDLLISHQWLSHNLNQLVAIAQTEKDTVTEGLLAHRKQVHDKNVWMLSSLLENWNER